MELGLTMLESSCGRRILVGPITLVIGVHRVAVSTKSKSLVTRADAYFNFGCEANKKLGGWNDGNGCNLFIAR